jgi:type II secretory pathway pseudopilin PulG
MTNKIALSARPGVSLVETLVAITLMGVVLSGLGGLAFTASRRTVDVAASGYRHGILVQEVNRLTAWPYTDLGSASGCTTVSTGTFPHQRCISVTVISSTRSQVRVIVTPSQPGVAADTVTVERTRPPVGSVLSTL